MDKRLSVELDRYITGNYGEDQWADDGVVVDTEAVEQAVRDLLVAIGEDPEREGLVGTPGRVARFWTEFADYQDGNLDTTFTTHTTDQMVVVSGIRVWSLCEHHLLPFYCDVAIGYIPTHRLLGLSKFGRIAHVVAHRLQVQERLVTEIADKVEQATESPHVAVLARGEHLCMTMRGIRTPSTMTSSITRGRFLDVVSTRQEFLRLVDMA